MLSDLDIRSQIHHIKFLPLFLALLPPVRRVVATILVFFISFSVGLASALDSDVFVNQDAVWSQALILSGCILIFLVIYFGIRKFRRDLFNSVSHFLPCLATYVPAHKHLMFLFTISFPFFCSMVSMTGHFHWYGCLSFCESPPTPFTHPYLSQDCSSSLRFLAPIEGAGMLIWWVVDEVINHSDPYEDYPWWGLSSESLMMTLSQVRMKS